MLKKTSAPNFLNIIFISCLMKTLQNLQWSIYTPLQKQIPHLWEVLSSLQCTNQTYASFLISVALGDSAYVSSEIHKQSYCLSAVVKDWKLLPETTAWEKTIFSEIIMIKLSIILEIKENQYQYLSNCACTHPSLDQTLTLTYYQFQYCCWVRGGEGQACSCSDADIDP